MSISKKSSKADLIKYAREELGLNPSKDLSPEDLIDLIDKNGGEFVDASESVNQGSTADDDIASTFVRLRIFEKANDEANKEVIVGVNGVFTQIQREKEVTVPYPIYEALKNSVTIDRKMVDGELVERSIQSEPFTVIKLNVQPGEFED